MRPIATCTLAATLLLAACSKEIRTEEPAPPAPAESLAKGKPGSVSLDITFAQQNLFPEGVVYDKFNDRFYVSSTTRGQIGIVTTDGTYTPFITDPALTSTTGLEIDNAHKLLYVSNSAGGTVGIYDINTGQRVNLVDLRPLLPGAPIYLNDIALDPQGNAYVTNSRSPVIYKITREGTASIFFQNAAFATPPGGFGFNGIEYANQGFLLVNFTFGNQVIKIPVSNPSAYSVVALDAPLDRPDGLLLSKNGKQLVVVNNANGGNGKVILFESKDKWETGTAAETFITGPVFPTTATSDGKNVFVMYAYLNKRSTPEGQTNFTIKQVPFGGLQSF